MELIALGLFGGVTYALSQQDEVRHGIDEAQQSAVDLLHTVQEEYAKTLQEEVTHRSAQPGYQRRCTVKYVWKWADERNYMPNQWKDYKQHYVAQSCSAQNHSTVPTAIYQGSSNGVDEDHPNWPDQNGGLNPILSQRSFDFFTNGHQGFFTENEEKAAEALLLQHGLPPQYGPAVIRTVKGVGFFKLSEYHWIATIDWALRLLDRDCDEQVSVKFHCTSEHSKWYTQEWQRRLRLAAGEYFQWETNGADPDSIRDYRGEPITVTPIWCGVDRLGEDVWSVPFACNEEHIFWPQDVQPLRTGPCRNLFRRLSTQFHEQKDPEFNRTALDASNSLPRTPAR